MLAPDHLGIGVLGQEGGFSCDVRDVGEAGGQVIVRPGDAHPFLHDDRHRVGIEGEETVLDTDAAEHREEAPHRLGREGHAVLELDQHLEDAAEVGVEVPQLGVGPARAHEDDLQVERNRCRLEEARWPEALRARTDLELTLSQGALRVS